MAVPLIVDEPAKPVGGSAGEIDDLVTRHRLERVRGARADGAPWLEKVQRRPGTAEAIVSDDPESAFVLASGWVT